MLDVEEMRKIENKLKKDFESMKDDGLTTSHIKPARKILSFIREALKRRKLKEEARTNNNNSLLNSS